MHDYDRRTAHAKLDLSQEWREIVDNHNQAMHRDFDALLKKLVPYLRSVGYDLDPAKSWLDVEYHGSDGARIQGQLHIEERDENTVYATDPRSVVKWVALATDMTGRATKIGELPSRQENQKRGVWKVDIGE
jgi:hypothetical protein